MRTVGSTQAPFCCARRETGMADNWRRVLTRLEKQEHSRRWIVTAAVLRLYHAVPGCTVPPHGGAAGRRSRLPSLAKEALGEGGDKADLDEQAHQRLEGGQLGERTIHRHVARQEAAPVERGHAEDERSRHRELRAIGL